MSAMLLADYTPEIEGLVASGSTTRDAISTVAATHSLKAGALQSAYYRTRRKRGAGKPQKSPKRPAGRVARPPARGEVTPPAPSNGQPTIEQLITRLKRNQAENAEITAALEALVSQYVQTLVGISGALTA